MLSKAKPKDGQETTARSAHRRLGELRPRAVAEVTDRPFKGRVGCAEKQDATEQELLG